MTHEQIMKQIDIERENRKRIYKNISRFIIAFIVIGGLFIISCLLTRHQVDIIYKMLILLGIVVIAFGYGMMLLMRFLASLEKEIILLTMTSRDYNIWIISTLTILKMKRTNNTNIHTAEASSLC